MKVGIIGLGGVGKACALSLVLRGCAREIVLIDKIQTLTKAVANDMRYGALLSPRADIYSGNYSDLKDCALVMITAGINEKTGGATDRNDPAGRLKLFGINSDIYREIIPQIIKSAPETVILVVTDPPDPLADVARQVAGHNRILSAGTYLDSLRLKFHIAKHLNVNPVDVNALVIGEHGTSSVFLWSSVTIAGKPLEELLIPDMLKIQQQIEREVKFANISIIEGNEASQYGIGMVCARITEMVLRNEQTIIPIGSYQPDFNVTFSLPSVVGSEGIRQVFIPKMSAEELSALEQSASVLKKTLI